MGLIKFLEKFLFPVEFGTILEVQNLQLSVYFMRVPIIESEILPEINCEKQGERRLIHDILMWGPGGHSIE